MVRQVYQFGRDVSDQLPLGLQWVFGMVGEAQAGGYAEDVCVDSHIGLTVDHRCDDIGRLASYTW